MEQSLQLNKNYQETLLKQKREAFNNCLDTVGVNTVKGMFYGFALGLVMKKKLAFTALGAGIGTSVAYQKCVSDFNMIKKRDERMHSFSRRQEADEEIDKRLSHLRMEFLKK